MKLLLDENLPERIVPPIRDLFPDSIHVNSVNLARADDAQVWQWAKEHDFTIVSKDVDFHQRSLLYGHPPKFIWLRIGNCPASMITDILRSHHQVIQEFIDSQTESILILGQ